MTSGKMCDLSFDDLTLLHGYRNQFKLGWTFQLASFYATIQFSSFASTSFIVGRDQIVRTFPVLSVQSKGAVNFFLRNKKQLIAAVSIGDSETNLYILWFES